MNKKKYISIFVIIIGIAILATIFSLRPINIFRPSVNRSSGVMFKLIDGDTNQPILNHKITICDNAIMYDRVDDGNYQGFCSEQKVWGHVMTNQEGEFYLDVKNIDITPHADIMIDAGKEYSTIPVIRSNATSQKHSSFDLRVLNQEKSGRVISNLFYNIDTKEVREVFTNGVPENISTFDLINIVVFKIK